MNIDPMAGMTGQAAALPVISGVALAGGNPAKRRAKSPSAEANHPDDWSPGLHFRIKSLNTKTVTRARSPAEVLPVVLAHNLRDGNGEHRHRHPIDPALRSRNQALLGPTQLDVAVELITGILDELDIQPRRVDTIMGVEIVIQPPAGHDLPAFYQAGINWVRSRYPHVISAVIHRDQARPHMHVVALAVCEGRLDGNGLTSGPNRIALQCRAFMAHMRKTLGLRTDRPVKSLADIMTSTGRGPKTRAKAAQRDADLERKTGAGPSACGDVHGGWIGMGVDEHAK